MCVRAHVHSRDDADTAYHPQCRSRALVGRGLSSPRAAEVYFLSHTKILFSTPSTGFMALRPHASRAARRSGPGASNRVENGALLPVAKQKSNHRQPVPQQGRRARQCENRISVRHAPFHTRFSTLSYPPPTHATYRSAVAVVKATGMPPGVDHPFFLCPH